MNKVKFLGVLLLFLGMYSCDSLDKNKIKEKIIVRRADVPSEDNTGKQYADYQEDKVYDMAEEMPEFPGGLEEMNEYILKSIRNSELNLVENTQGRVMITFVVGKEGNISDANIIRGINEEVDREALRIVQGMPRWKPGKHEGKNVSVRFTLPIKF